MLRFCGACRYFGYEDVYGVGSCLRGEGLEGFDKIRFCDQSGCDYFEEEDRIEEY